MKFQWNFKRIGVGQQVPLLYSWRFSRYSAPIHWLVHCHLTPNNETVSRQMPWAGNIAKTMTSNRKQFTVTREMLTAVACHWSITCLFVFQRFDPFALLYIKSLNDWSLGEQWILLPSNLNVSRDEEILGKQNSLFPSGPVIKCLLKGPVMRATFFFNLSRNIVAFKLKPSVARITTFVRFFTACSEGANEVINFTRVTVYFTVCHVFFFVFAALPRFATEHL